MKTVLRGNLFIESLIKKKYIFSYNKDKCKKSSNMIFEQKQNKIYLKLRILTKNQG